MRALWFTGVLGIITLNSLHFIAQVTQANHPNLLQESSPTFWSQLETLDKLLQPLHLVQALSEADIATSGQVLAAWNWLYQKTQSSDGLEQTDKDHLSAAFHSRWVRFVEDHHIVCWMLDPRLHGVGMSPGGRRRARDIGAKLYCRLFPEKADRDSINRLIRQWTEYKEKGMKKKLGLFYLYEYMHTNYPGL